MKALVLILSCCCLSGCEVQDQAMRKQKKFVTYAPSDLWPDGASARPLPEHVVTANGDAKASQPRVTSALIERGQRSYDVYCTPCHGYDGSGHGMVVTRGFPQPPTYHSTRLREASGDHLFDVITNGYGVMYPYGTRVPAQDRWAIVAYIRALQLTQLTSEVTREELTP